MSPTSIDRVTAMLRFFGSVSNLPLVTACDYHYYSHNKIVKGKRKTGQEYGTGIGGCNRLCPAASEA